MRKRDGLVVLLAMGMAGSAHAQAAGGVAAATSGAIAGRMPGIADFRLPTVQAPADTETPIDGVRSRLHTRLASKMMDFYPVDGSGLHLSFGTRFFVRRNFWAEMETSTQGLLAVPRMMASGGMRAGFRRMTPAATLGYTATLAPRLTLGLEAGARMGRAFASMPRRLYDAGGGRRGGSAGQPTVPMVNLVFDYGF